MEAADAQHGREGGAQRRSALDVIMSQIRRKRPASDRKPLGRFLSRSSEKTAITEDSGTETRENVSGFAKATEDEPNGGGWGRVCVFLQRLGKKADTRSLGVAHCDLTATDLIELATLLQFVPHLEEMDVSWNELIGGSLSALTSHLSHVGGIRVLRLCHCRLNNDDITELGEALSAIPLLEILDLSWNGGIGGKGLQSMLGRLPATLREVHLVACQLTAADAAALGGALCALPRLCVLDISSNPQLTQEVEGCCFRDLAAALSNANSLTALRLQDCGLSTDHLNDLGGSLRSLTSLRELDLSCNRGLSGGLDRLTADLAHLSHLESLDLHLSCLTRADLEALIQVLPFLTVLTELDVSSNKEAGGVAKELVSALPLMQMKRLPLNNCSLSQESFTALVLVAPYLRSIDLSWCKIVGGRTSLLLDALQPSVLLELRLSSCELSTADLCHLASACRHGRLSSLRLCDVSYNASVGDDGWCALFEAGGLGSLEELDLSLRPSSSASCSSWLPALLRALPGLTALSRLSAQRWRIGRQERQKLKQCLKKRKILMEFDTGVKDGTTSHQATNPKRTEE